MIPNETSIAVEPLVVVDAGPVEEAAHVDAALERVVRDLEPPLEVGGALVVVVGADAVLGDESGVPGVSCMEAVEHEPSPSAQIP